MGKEEGHLPFLDNDIYRKTDASLRHKVYRKPTHTNLHLHQNSHHHPVNKQTVFASLIHRAKALCDQDSLTQELEFLTTVFKDNGFSPQQIQVMEPATRTAKTNDKPTSTACIPYIPYIPYVPYIPYIPYVPYIPYIPYILYIPYIPYTQTYDRLSRMLAKCNTRSVPLPPRNICSYLPPVKDALGLRMLVYKTFHVNVASFILDKAVSLFKLESNNTIDMCG